MSDLMGDFRQIALNVGVVVIIGLAFLALQYFFNWLDWLISGRKSPKKTPPNFMLWILSYPGLSIDNALNAYIKHFRICIRLSLDEPEVITKLRTKVHIMESCGIIRPNDPDNPGDPILLIMHQTVKMWDNGNPEIKNQIVDGLTQKSIQKLSAV